MNYSINVTPQGDWLYVANVTVRDDQNIVVLQGETSVSCETEQEAYDYAERVFLTDLRTNFPRLIGDLVFPWEEEPENADPEVEGQD